MPSPPPLSQALPTEQERLHQHIADLRDDQWRSNAVDAFYYFRVNAAQIQGMDDAAQALLYEGLNNPDRQGRLLCAALLMQIDAAPTAGLLAVAI